MRLQVDDGAVQVKSCAGGISLLIIEGLGEFNPECAIVTLTRKQVIELIAMLVANTHPLPTQQELDDELMRLVFSNLPPGDLTGTMTEDDFMEDHGDNLKQGDLVRLTKDYYQYLKEGEVGRIYIAQWNSPIWTIEIPDGPDVEREEGEYPFFRHFVHEDYIELVD